MLRSRILAGNARLERAALGPPSIKRAPPNDDFDAVQRIQTALKELGYVMPVSFKMGRPDGKFGDETYRTVLAFQRSVFPKDPLQWDGRVGRNTLAQLDDALTGSAEAVELPAVTKVSSISTVTVPPSGFVYCTDPGGTFEKSGPSPSTIVGWTRTASRSLQYGRFGIRVELRDHS